MNVSNSTIGSGAISGLRLICGVSEFQMLKFSTSVTAYKIALAGDAVVYNNGSVGDIAILNDFATGSIKFAAGSSSTAQMTLASTGALTVVGATTIATTSTTGYSLVVQNSGASDTTGIRLTSGGTDNGYFITAYNAVSKYASLQAGDNDAYRNIILNNLGGNVGIGVSPTEKLHVSGNILISGVNSFKMRNLAGTDVNVIRAVSGGANVLSTTTLGNHIAMGTQSAHDFLLCSNDTERIRLSNEGWFSHINATNPSASVTDSYVQYSADVVAGNAAAHFRTENGAVIKLYQETTAVGNSTISVGGGSAVLDDTEFDGYTLRQIVKALRNQGILA
jgi:putative intracellular protease/amidase